MAILEVPFDFRIVSLVPPSVNSGGGTLESPQALHGRQAVQGFSQSAWAQGLLVKKRCDASKHRVANVASISCTNRISGQKMPDNQTTNTVRSSLTRF